MRNCAEARLRGLARPRSRRRKRGTPSSASTTLKARPRIGLALHLGLELAPVRRVVDQRRARCVQGLTAEMTIGASNSSPLGGDDAAHWLAVAADRGDRLAGHDRRRHAATTLRRQRLDDRAHAADRKAGRAAQRDQPRVLRATGAQRGQRQRPHHQVERRAGRRRRDLAADHGERRDQGLGLRRELELVHEVARIAEQDAAEGFLVFQAREVAHEMLQRRRRLEDRDAQPVGEALQIGEEGVVAGGLARREGLELRRGCAPDRASRHRAGRRRAAAPASDRGARMSRP